MLVGLKSQNTLEEEIVPIVEEVEYDYEKTTQ